VGCPARPGAGARGGVRVGWGIDTPGECGCGSGQCSGHGARGRWASRRTGPERRRAAGGRASGPAWLSFCTLIPKSPRGYLSSKTRSSVPCLMTWLAETSRMRSCWKDKICAPKHTAKLRARRMECNVGDRAGRTASGRKCRRLRASRRVSSAVSPSPTHGGMHICGARAGFW
jgi:hypothetical protein